MGELAAFRPLDIGHGRGGRGLQKSALVMRKDTHFALMGGFRSECMVCVMLLLGARGVWGGRGCARLLTYFVLRMYHIARFSLGGLIFI